MELALLIKHAQWSHDHENALNAITSARRFAYVAPILFGQDFRISKIYRIERTSLYEPQTSFCRRLCIAHCRIRCRSAAEGEGVHDRAVYEHCSDRRQLLSADEKSILFHNNKTGIFNVYSVPVTGGAPRS